MFRSTCFQKKKNIPRMQSFFVPSLPLKAQAEDGGSLFVHRRNGPWILVDILASALEIEVPQTDATVSVQDWLSKN
jgi:hypothetical protein